MKVNAFRLLKLLGDERGFALAWQDPQELGLVRASTVDGLHEQLLVSAAGRAGEALACEVAISITRRQLGTKGMCELEVVTDLATDLERGLTIVETGEQVELWEKGIAEIAPAAVGELAKRKGTALLARTEKARSAVQSYLKELPGSEDLQELHAWLLARVPPDGVKGAQELAEAPGVLQKAGAELQYLVTCLTIVTFGLGGQDLAKLKLDPVNDRELMWRIQLLADTLEARQLAAEQPTA